MAAHSGILACRISQTGGPGGRSPQGGRVSDAAEVKHSFFLSSLA